MSTLFPVRAALPLLCLTATCAISPAFAQSLQAELQTCAQYSDDSKRLACYDKLSGNLQQYAEKQFGQEEKQVLEEAPESITATVTEMKEGAYGKITFALDNGQFWRQTDNTRVTWKNGVRVELERGVLGAFYMRDVNGGRRVKVKRIQ